LYAALISFFVAVGGTFRRAYRSPPGPAPPGPARATTASPRPPAGACGAKPSWRRSHRNDRALGRDDGADAWHTRALARTASRDDERWVRGAVHAAAQAACVAVNIARTSWRSCGDTSGDRSHGERGARRI
jgi:hypothetical protein